MGNKYNILNEIGFSSFHDIFKSVTGIKHNINLIHILGFTIGSIATIIQEFISDYIYNPSSGVLILFAVTIVDIVLGVSNSISNGKGIECNKLSRAFIRFTIQIIFVSFFYNMNMLYNYIIYSWMVDSILVIFTLSTFWSAWYNAHKLGFITDDQYSTLESIINIKEIFNRFKKKNTEL
jgi:hypothetical protein